MKYIRLISKILAVTIISFSVLSLATPLVFADAKSAACEGAGLTANGDGTCSTPNGSPEINITLARALNIFSIIIGIIAVVMIMIGGLKFITSSGDPASTNSAKNTIIFAAVGLVIVALSQFIVHFVLERFK